MKQFFLILLILSFCFPSVWAQQTMKGVIVDESNLPLPGATVLVKHTQKGTISDVNGNYSISVSDNDTLMISMLGMATQSIAVLGKTVINVKLVAESKPNAWRLWEFDWRTPSKPERARLIARATDSQSRTQPTQRDPDRGGGAVIYSGSARTPRVLAMVRALFRTQLVDVVELHVRFAVKCDRVARF